jgi:hypothetical protein
MHVLYAATLMFIAALFAGSAAGLLAEVGKLTDTEPYLLTLNPDLKVYQQIAVLKYRKPSTSYYYRAYTGSAAQTSISLCTTVTSRTPPGKQTSGFPSKVVTSAWDSLISMHYVDRVSSHDGYTINGFSIKDTFTIIDIELSKLSVEMTHQISQTISVDVL